MITEPGSEHRWLHRLVGEWTFDVEAIMEPGKPPLDTEGPAFGDEGKPARYKDVIEITSDDQRVLTSHVLGEDGRWRQFMTATYRRKR